MPSKLLPVVSWWVLHAFCTLVPNAFKSLSWSPAHLNTLSKVFRQNNALHASVKPTLECTKVMNAEVQNFRSHHRSICIPGTQLFSCGWEAPYWPVQKYTEALEAVLDNNCWPNSQGILHIWCLHLTTPNLTCPARILGTLAWCHQYPCSCLSFFISYHKSYWCYWHSPLEMMLYMRSYHAMRINTVLNSVCVYIYIYICSSIFSRGNLEIGIHMWLGGLKRTVNTHIYE